MKIIIVGLRRSGTTALWRAFRGDNRIRCYNEPFNPEILKLSQPSYHSAKYYMEYKELIDSDQDGFWDHYSPIENIYELQQGLTVEQCRYLTYLETSANHSLVLLEMTRAHFKIQDLAKLFPDSILIHLYRPAAAFVSSVMVPSLNNTNHFSGIFKQVYDLLYNRLRAFERKRTFWTTQDARNAWSFDQLIGGSTQSPFSCHLRDVELVPEMVYKLPSVGRLLSYWKVCYNRAEEDGNQYFKNRFISLNFKDFCANPEAELRRIYKLSGLLYQDIKLSWVHKHNMPYAVSHPEWERYANLLRIEKKLLK